MAFYPLDGFNGKQVVQYSDPSAGKAGDIFFSMAATREGCYIANGAAYAVATDAELFAEIGNTFNTQINPTTGAAWATPGAGFFRVPDMRGVVPRGAGTPHDGVALAVGGYEADQMQGHIHFNDRLAGAISGSTGQNYATGGVGANSAGQVTTPRTDGVSGAPRTGAETRVKSRGGNWFIRRFNPTPQVIGSGEVNNVTPGILPKVLSARTLPFSNGSAALWRAIENADLPALQLYQTVLAVQDTANAGVWTINSQAMALPAGTYEIGFDVTIILQNISAGAGGMLVNATLWNNTAGVALSNLAACISCPVGSGASFYSSVSRKAYVTLPVPAGIQFRMACSGSAAVAKGNLPGAGISGTIPSPNNSQTMWARRIGD